MTKLSSFRLAGIAAAAALCGAAALAGQTIGIQPVGTAASATASVNIRVLVPKIVILRVGNAGSVPQVDFSYALTGLTTGANSQAYTGTIPPAAADFAATITRTNPVGADGDVTVGAWTNTAGTTLTCQTAALGGATPFGGADAPALSDISVTAGGATPLGHPGATLASCDGSATAALTERTAYSGTYTYAPAAGFNPATVNPGTYGAVVTYTATTP